MTYLVKVDITSFLTSMNGEHYYGQLKVAGEPNAPSNSVYLERPATQAEATYLNKKDGNVKGYYWIEEGDMVARFTSPEEVYVAATKVFAESFDSDDLLWYGKDRKISCALNGEYWEEDMVFIAGPGELVDTLNAAKYRTEQRLILKANEYRLY